MDYVDVVVVGSKTIGKHSLIHSFQDKSVEKPRHEDVSLSLMVENKKVDFVVKVVDEDVDSKLRRLMYLKADVIILGYSTVDLVSFHMVKKKWMPELHAQAPNVPVLMMGTKIDRVPEDLRDKVRVRGEKTAKELGCIGFQEVTAVAALNALDKMSTTLFERAVQSGLAKKRVQQKLFDQDARKKKGLLPWAAKKQVSVSEIVKESADLQNTKAVATKITTSTTDYTYRWRGELVCSLVEDFLDGRIDYGYVDSMRDMNEPLDLDLTVEAATDISRKLMLYYHFVPVVSDALETHNLEFWLDVEDFKYNGELRTKGKTNKKLKKEAVRIYRDFIPLKSSKEINIDDDVRNDITVKVKTVNHNRVFDLAQIHILSQLAVIFRERFASSHTVRAMLSVFNNAAFLPPMPTENEDDILPKPAEDGLGRMLRQIVHIQTLMEFLHSSSASDKRPAVVQFMTETDELKMVQLGTKYLLFYAALKAHIDKEKSQENLMFWLDAEDFRSLDFGQIEEDPENHDRQLREQLATRAKYIVNRYINDDAEWLINLPGNLTRAIKAQLEELLQSLNQPTLEKPKRDELIQRSQHMFDAAQREILLLMKRDSWRRFQASDEARVIKGVVTKLFSHEEFVDPDRERVEAKFQQRFDLMSDEGLMRVFSCALARNMLLHGQLTISKRHLCFFSSVFGFKTKFVYNFADIVDISKEEEEIIPRKGAKSQSRSEEGVVIKTADDLTHTFKNILPNRNQLYYTLRKARQRAENGLVEKSVRRRDFGKNDDADLDEMSDDENTKGMTDQDWELFKEGANVVEFQRDEVILEEGTPAGSVFQIARGTCRIEKTTVSGEKIKLRSCAEGEIIGEISFIEGGTTSASVVAESDDVVVYVMERDFVEKALVDHPGLPGRFYKFLATLLADRLRTKKVVDQGAGEGQAETFTDATFRHLFGLKDENASVMAEWVASVKDKSMVMYGKLYLSQSVLCFYSKVLGSVKRVVIPLNDITHVETHGRVLRIVRRAIDTKNEFDQIDNVDIVRETIQKQLLEAHKEDADFQGLVDNAQEDIDWSQFLSGAELKSYAKDEPVLMENQSTQYVYQLGHGSTRVQKNTENGFQVFREMGVGELFGEMSFLQGGAASASIVAGEHGAWVYCIEKKFVDSLLDLNAELPGRFYKFLASSLASRLRS